MQPHAVSARDRRAGLAAGLVVACAVTCAVACTGPAGSDADASGSATPAPRSSGSSTPEADAPVLGASHELLPDPAGGGVLLLTGPPEGDVAADGPIQLWRWDGTSWGQLRAPGEAPPARSFFAAGYDSGRDVVVLYGGDLPAAEAGVTWEWDGDRWTARPAAGPGPRLAAAMAWDPASSEVVLYGGDDGAGKILNDTWSWDGQRWDRVARSGPDPARWPAVLVSGPADDVLVMYGGHQVVDESLPGALADTWTWRATGWTRTPAGGPGRLVNAEAVAHPELGVLLVGGSDMRQDSGDVWRWDGGEWTLLGRDVFPARQAFGLAYDADRDTVVLTGGLVAAGEPGRHQDVWEWAGDPGAPAVKVADLGAR